MATYNDNSNSRFGDGLPLKSRRGPIGENWWAREWLAIIEADCAQPELEAGRRLARQGRVPELQLAAGELGSHVEESREIKFEVKMTFELLSPAQREAVLGELTMNTLHLAMLYAGKMPKDMNDVFDRAGARFLPGSKPQISCTCDEAAVCRHAAAVACLVAERIDQDPFVLLALRGLSRTRFINAVRDNWGAPPLEATPSEAAAPPLERQLDGFYRCPVALPTDSSTLGLPELDVLECLGHASFFPPGDRNVQQTLDNLYNE